MNGALNRYESDSHFLELLQAIQGRTLIDVERLYMIYQIAGHCSKNIPGYAAEIGVYKGGSAYILADRFLSFPREDAKLILFDTFQGMPKTREGIDLHKHGDFDDVDYRDVQNFLKPFRGIEYRVGFFPETIQESDKAKYSFVHADADIFDSTKDICEFFAPDILQKKLSPGGMILFDDYGFPSCPGAKKAVDECLNPTKVIYFPTGQALYINHRQETK